jgi:DNA-binding NarL/FixJ family response regulator
MQAEYDVILSQMITRFPEDKFHENVHATFFPPLSSFSDFEPGVVHESPTLRGGPVLGGTCFGGMFEIVNSPLTRAQTRILTLKAIGLSISQVKTELHVSEPTIRTHHKAILQTLGANSLAGAVATAFQGEASFFFPYVYGKFEGEMTKAQKPIVEGLVQGLNLSEIAVRQYLSLATVRTHVKNINVRLDMPANHHVNLISLANLTDVIIERGSDAEAILEYCDSGHFAIAADTPSTPNVA